MADPGTLSEEGRHLGRWEISPVGEGGKTHAPTTWRRHRTTLPRHTALRAHTPQVYVGNLAFNVSRNARTMQPTRTHC